MLRLMAAAATAVVVVRGVALPQDINFGAIDNAPTPTAQGAPVGIASEVPTYAPAKASAAAQAEVASGDLPAGEQKRNVLPRQACQAQPAGAGPTTSPDTASDFLDNPTYDNLAQSADVPQGYDLAFSDLQGASQQNGYLGFYTLQNYDPIQCQQYCDQAPSCYAFNLYIERDPSVEPGDDCPNPSSTVNYKCSLYGLEVSNITATNTGQWQAQFQIVITASNGYNKVAPPPSYINFTSPTELGGAINAPDLSTYIGQKYYPGPYDPSQCAAACQATTEYDVEHLVRNDGSYDACNFFNSYVLSENNVPQGTYCAMYTQVWDKSYSTNYGQYRGDDYYSVSSSYGYALTPQDPGQI